MNNKILFIICIAVTLVYKNTNAQESVFETHTYLFSTDSTAKQFFEKDTIVLYYYDFDTTFTYKNGSLYKFDRKGRTMTFTDHALVKQKGKIITPEAAGNKVTILETKYLILKKSISFIHKTRKYTFNYYEEKNRILLIRR